MIPERADELRMMRSAESWPRWPFLPVKKRPTIPGQWPEFGVMMDTGTLLEPTVKPVVYDYNVWSGEHIDVEKVKEQFNTLEELVDAGWVVD